MRKGLKVHYLYFLSSIFCFYIDDAFCVISEQSRDLQVDYSINASYVENEFGVEDSFLVSNYVGSSVSPEIITVDLMSNYCEAERNSTGYEIELLNKELNTTSRLFSYNVFINQDLISSSPGNFVNFTDDIPESNGFGSGYFSFCTRVKVCDGPIVLQAFETNFLLHFNHTVDGLNLNSVNVEADEVQVFNVDIEESYSVLACQCRQHRCDSSNVKQGERLEFCISVRRDDPNLPIEQHISNFYVKFASGSNEYNPVEFGEDTWDADMFTTVEALVESKVIVVKAPILADFYQDNIDYVDVTGNAFLSFDVEKGVKTFSSKVGYNFRVNITHVDDSTSCIGLLLEKFRSFTKNAVP